MLLTLKILCTWLKTLFYNKCKMKKTFSMNFGVLCLVFVQIAINECEGGTMFNILLFLIILKHLVEISQKRKNICLVITPCNKYYLDLNAFTLSHQRKTPNVTSAGFV